MLPGRVVRRRRCFFQTACACCHGAPRFGTGLGPIVLIRCCSRTQHDLPLPVCASLPRLPAPPCTRHAMPTATSPTSRQSFRRRASFTRARPFPQAPRARCSCRCAPTPSQGEVEKGKGPAGPAGTDARKLLTDARLPPPLCPAPAPAPTTSNAGAAGAAPAPQFSFSDL